MSSLTSLYDYAIRFLIANKDSTCVLTHFIESVKESYSYVEKYLYWFIFTCIPEWMLNGPWGAIRPQNRYLLLTNLQTCHSVHLNSIFLKPSFIFLKLYRTNLFHLNLKHRDKYLNSVFNFHRHFHVIPVFFLKQGTPPTHRIDLGLQKVKIKLFENIIRLKLLDMPYKHKKV